MENVPIIVHTETETCPKRLKWIKLLKIGNKSEINEPRGSLKKKKKTYTNNFSRKQLVYNKYTRY